MKYAVAYISYFDDALKLAVIEADDPITAIVEGVRSLLDDSGNPEDTEWLDLMLENIPAPGPAREARIEEIEKMFYHADEAVAVLPI